MVLYLGYTPTIVPLPNSRSSSPATERVILSSNIQFHTFISFLIHIYTTFIQTFILNSYSQIFTFHSIKSNFWDRNYRYVGCKKSELQSPWGHKPVDESIVGNGAGVDVGGGGRIVNDDRIGAVAGPATAAKAETGDTGRGQSTAARNKTLTSYGTK